MVAAGHELAKVFDLVLQERLIPKVLQVCQALFLELQMFKLARIFEEEFMIESGHRIDPVGVVWVQHLDD